MKTPMKLRFAPSPTGFLHVGGARTAIFNLLHAGRQGGSMLLRIEDTDVERSRQHHAEQILTSLRWLGIEWDEGPIYQSDRLSYYIERAEELVLRGRAYRCYCTIEELEEERTAAEASGKQWRYSGRCRESALAAPATDSRAHVIRFRVEPGPIVFHDLIRGAVQFDADLIDDFVLLRSDRHPTYHLSVVVDDIDMGITLVARGDDHLSNTPKHILLFRAFDAEPPDFAHLPLILGADRKRLSKRTGATSAEEYRDMGILPAALFNFLLLLGWAPGDDRELMTIEEARGLFDLSHVNKAPAVFDPEKLLWMNGQYMIRATPDELWPHLAPFLSGQGSLEELRPIIGLMHTRARTLRDLADMMQPYLAADESLKYDPAAAAKHLKGADVRAWMEELHEALTSVQPFDVTSTEAALRGLAEARGVGAGKYIHPLRLALTGLGASPPIFDVAVVLGRERTLRRLRRLIDFLGMPNS
jgi:glutamyl-tRNA synthetase